MARSSYKNFPQRIFKILMHRPSEEDSDVNRISTRFSHKDQYEIIEDLEDCTRTSSRASHQDLYKVTQRPRTACHQDLHKSFSQGLVKDIDHDLHARTPKRSSQDRHKRRCCWSGSTCKTWHLQDLHARTS